MFYWYIICNNTISNPISGGDANEQVAEIEGERSDIENVDVVTLEEEEKAKIHWIDAIAKILIPVMYLLSV